MKHLEKLLGKNIEKLPVADEELNHLMDIVNRDMDDAKVKLISNDRRFTAAYNAALQLCTIIIRKSGYRIKGHQIGKGKLCDSMGDGKRKTENG